jgi:hypothetical protein
VIQVVGQAPIASLYQRATLAAIQQAAAPSQATSGLTLLNTAAQEFRHYHQSESIGFLLGSSFLDMLDGSLSGTILGVFLGTSFSTPLHSTHFYFVALSLHILTLFFVLFSFMQRPFYFKVFLVSFSSFDPVGLANMGSAFAFPREYQPTVGSRLRDLVCGGLTQALGFGLTAAVCLPLHVANFQVRQHQWRGRAGVFPLWYAHLKHLLKTHPQVL